ncbi:hypothetical protein [Rickettsiales endosymbiont of Trichoplax sp. H2]|uniref:hypothetical protein n=1 Tax=Rickettsiales endosymbiont of Trichoplax sp. H2 TaxID=2021221 RepID=UPI0012B3C7B1|nr:hypothetical protein [Rickettsiales endosymbiont of Trichoplax sp. H2]MSO13471.1 hypothetical protein [Rickettsiales endosymbiont of Trichoplax sp. H2]
MSIFHNILNNCTLENNEIHLYHLKEIYAYKSIWRAVITQALMDASSNSKKKFAKKQKIDAIRWLLDDLYVDEFKMVCNLADLDYKNVLVKIKKALANGCKWRNDNKNN